MADRALLTALAETARAAGEEILALVRRGFEIEQKRDQSPVTVCDRAAEAVILDALARLAPDVPVIAEEEVAAGRIPLHGDTFFLVDPLDGTKEFVRGGDDYTVNIGLIEAGAPVLGVVFAPATQILHAGRVGDEAWVETIAGRAAIRTRARPEQVTAVASKSHLTQSTVDYLAAVGTAGHVSIGSSLKFCLLAEGRADLYPRLSPTSEWDTAAGHAVLLAAGGRCDAPEGGPLRYGKRGFINRGFLATGGWEAPSLAPFLADFAGGGDRPQGV
ncbi:3'(2'),5'-bisphosphate nucleotidase [Sphingomonas ginkgonis]|uniref:3'(2'),5'-bisphosphate nucleotidase CysQ n=1 Tax=Sphingomonas ginkgonis TaxID=2315330 RepID=A0A429VD46_9SPHN|nr:3'(2'),5'-bisphosphate nucleotidase CysQ [Sphingomonas ginkgonis]RST31908.1 3'(2'),5'-bisphosphate nucleotidase [Sphingomonas ginkgonis]